MDSYQYYLVVDTSTQWFTKLAAISEKHTQSLDVPTRMLDAPFFSQIFSREQWPKPIELKGEQPLGWAGWNISKQEFDRIARMIELWPAVQEFNKLQEYNV
jgi:hypothetical protein